MVRHNWLLRNNFQLPKTQFGNNQFMPKVFTKFEIWVDIGIFLDLQLKRNSLRKKFKIVTISVKFGTLD